MKRVLAALAVALVGTSALAGVPTRDQQREAIRKQGEAFCNHYPDDIACVPHGEALPQPPPPAVAPPPPPPPPVVAQQPIVPLPPPPVYDPCNPCMRTLQQLLQPPAVAVLPPPPVVALPPPLPPPPTCVVTGPPWVWQNVRVSPNGPIMFPLAPGTPVALLNVWQRWGQVRAPLGSVGWMFLPYMSCA